MRSLCHTQPLHARLRLASTVGCLVALVSGVLPLVGSGAEVQAPLLFVKVQAPVGSRVTFLEGPKVERAFEPPVTVGLKPGYAYRLRIDGVPNNPNMKLYPTLEVGGTLCKPPRLRAADFPALLQFTETDLQHAVAGAFITKVIVIEDSGASPFPLQDPENPSEWEVQPGEDPIAQAKTFGRVVLILRLGLFEPGPAELAQLHTGLILFPDMKTLPPQNVPPNIDPTPFFDRRHCLEDPVEALRDGGDRGTPAYFEANGNLRGVNPSDTVAEYRNSLGGRRLAVSNEVCVFAPRFLAVRHELPPLVLESSRPVVSLNTQQGNRQFAAKANTRQAAQANELQQMRARDRLRAGVGNDQLKQIIELQVLEAVEIDVGAVDAIGRERIRTLSEREKAKLIKQVELAIKLSHSVGARGVIEQLGPNVVGSVDGVGRVSAAMETRAACYLCEKIEPAVPERPLMLCKWASTQGAKVGDILTFYIRYANHGGKPIHEIAVVDSLAARLEYIPGSAKSDREAILVTQDNEAGSVSLRWEIRQALPPGEQGLVSFQARVR